MELDNDIFDVCVIGCGVAGVFAALRLSQEKDVRAIFIEAGRPPAKRRHQTEGWLGCMPSGDGKLYQNDLNQVANLIGQQETSKAYEWIKEVFESYSCEDKTPFNVTKSSSPNSSIMSKLNDLKFETELNDFIQIYPRDIHALSKQIALKIEDNENISFCFDSPVIDVKKEENFIVKTEDDEFVCKKLILCVGRSGWRFAKKIFDDFNLISNDDFARFGIQVEAEKKIFEGLNESCISLKKNDYQAGPFLWNGTMVPEDHFDFACSSFRSNENRWKSEKVNFQILGTRCFKGKGFKEMERLSNLTFIITNERIAKEKLNLILKGDSKLSVMKEFDWLKDVVKDLAQVFPKIAEKSYFYFPTVLPMVPKVEYNEFETNLKNFYVVGESAGIPGILAAMVSGKFVAEKVLRAS